MYIESLQITSFAGLNGFTLDLKDGMNIVRGRNEAGKSTLAEFIRYVFYGFNGKSERDRYLGFSSNIISGSVIVREGDKRYRIERKTSGAKDPVTVYDLDTGSSCYEGRVPGEVFLNMPAGLFSSTAYVGQAGGNAINGKSTAELLDNLLFAADEGVNVKKALKRIDDAKVSLLYKNKKGGRIYDLEGELSTLDSRYERAKRDSEELLGIENKLKENDKKLDYVSKTYQTVFSSIEDYRLKKSREKKERLRILEECYKEATGELDAHRQKYTRNGFFPDQSYLDSLRDCASEVVRCEERLSLVEKRLENLNRDIEKKREQREEDERRNNEMKAKIGAKRSVAVAAAVICILLSIASTAGCAFMFISAKSMEGIGLGALSLLFLGAMILFFALVTKYSSQIKDIEDRTLVSDDGFEAKLEVIREDLSDLRAERARYSSALNDLCSRWNVVYSKAALSEMVNVMEENRRLEGEAERARIAYVQMKTDAEENRESEPEDDGRDLDVPEDFDYKDADRNLKLAEEMIRLKQDVKHKCEVRLAQLSATAEAPYEIAELIKGAEDKKAQLEKRYEAYSLAFEKIEAASEKMRRSVSPRLSAGASEKMKALTDGKYSEIGVNGEFSMTFRPLSGGGKVTKEEMFMSAGTSDIAYISLRLSLSELICGIIPPTVFDESFSRLDDGRLANMMRLLSKTNGQMIVLTSNGREEEILKKEGICHNFVNIE